jgi:hypothetical protein
MKKLNKLVALTSVLALLTGQVQGQEYQEYQDTSSAYTESGEASYMSALLPIGALIVAGVIIATTDRHHHHGSGSSSSSSSSSHGHFSHSSSSSSSF